MKQSEAVRVVHALAAAFRSELPEETVVIWARQLMPFDVADGLEAVEILSTTQAFMPSSTKLLLDMMADIRRVRGERTPALPDVREGCCRGQWFGHAYREHFNDREREQADKLIAKAKSNPPMDRRVVLEAFLKLVGS